MRTQTTAHVHPDTALTHKVNGRDHDPFVSLRLGADLALLFSDPDDLERLAAEAITARDALSKALDDATSAA